ncbi:MAG: hypothetical protein LBI14_11300, partial [Treponema sp.]|nr:hypothetical protein [Treponema sp.]
GAEIAALLDIPPATVRWHVSEIKKKLKEGIEMEENLSFEQKVLWCGHDGEANDYNMRGIGHNPLVNNICIACYGKELTIEEISRTLRVAAAYIEPLVEDLLYMDYFRTVGKNRYTTNFYIETAHFRLSKARYYLNNLEPIARRISEVFRRYLDEIKAVGFFGSDLDSDFLLWALIPVALQKLYYRSLESILNKNKIVIDTPLRKDGSRHWVHAGFDEASSGFTPEEKDFSKRSTHTGIKTNNADTGEKTLQYDGYFIFKTGKYWREVFSEDDMRAIRHIAELIRKNETPNDYDKMRIAAFVQQGYAKMEGGNPKLMIPFFDAEEWASFNAVLDKIQKEIGETLFAGLIEGFAEAMEKEIPSFISKDEKTYLKYSAYPQYALLCWLVDNGLLRDPTDEEAKRLSTVVWCEK